MAERRREEALDRSQPGGEAIKKAKLARRNLGAAENAVDLDTGAVVAVTLQPANRGDTASLPETLDQADANLVAVMQDAEAVKELSEQVLSETVTDKGYHSNETLVDQGNREIRTYTAEPDRGRRHWEGKAEEQKAVYANRRRIRGKRGKRLMRKRGEYMERTFSHCYDTGGMCRTHLKHHDNNLKRLLIHVAGFNLILIMRRELGKGTTRGLQGLAVRRVWASVTAVWQALKPLAEADDRTSHWEWNGRHVPPQAA